MTKVPLVSIILSVYKPSPQALETTITSVLNQTMENFEFFIIKDDDLEETLKSITFWKHRDPRIKLIDNNINLGLITSLNKGLDSACAPLIARIDVGDLWESDKLKRQSELFEKNPNLYLCGTSLVLVDHDYNPLGYHTVTPSHNTLKTMLLQAKNPFAHSSIMFRKTNLRYNPQALYCEDFELWCRYSQLGEMTNIEDPLTHYVIDTSGITIQKRSLMIENTTRVYCAFLQALQRRESAFIQKGLSIKTFNTLSKFQLQSNQWYAKAVLASIRRHTLQKIGYLLLALLSNPSLITNKLKRIYCQYTKEHNT